MEFGAMSPVVDTSPFTNHLIKCLISGSLGKKEGEVVGGRFHQFVGWLCVLFLLHSSHCKVPCSDERGMIQSVFPQFFPSTSGETKCSVESASATAVLLPAQGSSPPPSLDSILLNMIQHSCFSSPRESVDVLSDSLNPEESQGWVDLMFRALITEASAGQVNLENYPDILINMVRSLACRQVPLVLSEEEGIHLQLFVAASVTTVDIVNLKKESQHNMLCVLSALGKLSLPESESLKTASRAIGGVTLSSLTACSKEEGVDHLECLGYLKELLHSVVLRWSIGPEKHSQLRSCVTTCVNNLASFAAQLSNDDRAETLELFGSLVVSGCFDKGGEVDTILRDSFLRLLASLEVQQLAAGRSLDCALEGFARLVEGPQVFDKKNEEDLFLVRKTAGELLLRCKDLEIEEGYTDQLQLLMSFLRRLIVAQGFKEDSQDSVEQLIVCLTSKLSCRVGNPDDVGCCSLLFSFGTFVQFGYLKDILTTSGNPLSKCTCFLLRHLAQLITRAPPPLSSCFRALGALSLLCDHVGINAFTSAEDGEASTLLLEVLSQLLLQLASRRKSIKDFPKECVRYMETLARMDMKGCFCGLSSRGGSYLLSAMGALLSGVCSLDHRDTNTVLCTSVVQSVGTLVKGGCVQRLFVFQEVESGALKGFQSVFCRVLCWLAKDNPDALVWKKVLEITALCAEKELLSDLTSENIGSLKEAFQEGSPFHLEGTFKKLKKEQQDALTSRFPFMFQQ